MPKAKTTLSQNKHYMPWVFAHFSFNLGVFWISDPLKSAFDPGQGESSSLAEYGVSLAPSENPGIH